MRSTRSSISSVVASSSYWSVSSSSDRDDIRLLLPRFRRYTEKRVSGPEPKALRIQPRPLGGQWDGSRGPPGAPRRPGARTGATPADRITDYGIRRDLPPSTLTPSRAWPTEARSPPLARARASWGPNVHRQIAASWMRPRGSGLYTAPGRAGTPAPGRPRWGVYFSASFALPRP